MRWCRRLTKLPADIGGLSSLKGLDLSGCRDLQELPRHLGQLSSLQSLSLRGCESLRELPDTGKIADSLEEIDISGCCCFKQLPEGFGNMSSLTELRLKGLRSLTSLPRGFGNLMSLNTLKITHCDQLTSLPAEIGQLRSLECMTLESCKNLKELPEGFGGLMSLKRLKIVECDSLRSLPHGFGQLRSLTLLSLRGCAKLERLPVGFDDLSSLTELALDGCEMLEGVEMKNVVKLERLCLITIIGCHKLREEWEQMRNEEEYSLAVIHDEEQVELRLEVLRAVGARLIDGQCRLLDCNGQSIRCSDVMESGTTVGFLMAKSDSSSEELRSLPSDNIKIISFEEADPFWSGINFSQNTLPEGFHAVPSTDIKSRILLTMLFYNWCTSSGIMYMDVKLNEKKRKCFDVPKRASEEENTEEDSSNKDVPTKLDFNTISEFTEQLEMNKIEYFIAQDGTKVNVGDLGGKIDAVFVCGFEDSFSLFGLMKMYTAQKATHPNFQAVWVPLDEDFGLGAFERARACMPWFTLPNPKLLPTRRRNCIVLSKDKAMINEEDMQLLLRGGEHANPFTEVKMDELKRKELSDLQRRSSMEFILRAGSYLDSSGNTVDRELLQGKVILLEPKLSFVYRKLKEKKTENFEIIYVGCNIPGHYNVNYNDRNQETWYDLHGTERMPWLRLSFSDMVTFWLRYRSLFKNQNSHLVEAPNWGRIQRLLSRLYYEEKKIPSVLVVFDSNGEVVTGAGEEVVELLSKSEGDDEEEEMRRQQVIEGMNTGKKV